MHEGWMWWMHLHGLVFLLIVAAVIVGAVLIVRSLWHAGGRPPSAGTSGSALELLDARYARGEIEREEYLQRRRDLLARDWAPDQEIGLRPSR